MTLEFRPFPKIPRLVRDIYITEKLDGTNAIIHISDTNTITAGSRNRWLSTHSDNYGFASWVFANTDELLKLGPGYHNGEWWGKGIQRNYNLSEKRFSLFNVSLQGMPSLPSCCHFVPVLYKGPFDTSAIDKTLDELSKYGSVASPGFMNPEGVVIYHTQANTFFKKTLENDSEGKGEITC